MDISQATPAVVSGGASGLGLAVATALRAAGAPVALFDIDDDKGAQAAESLGAIYQRADVSAPASVGAALNAARDAQGQERICVNCAGIAPGIKTVSKGVAHDPAVFARTITVNLIGTFNLASQSAAGMVAGEPLNADGERGVIINTASVAAFEGQIGQVAYAASKGGVVGMTLPMARDLSREGVRVMTIAPGIFGTPMLMGLAEEIREALGASVPFPSRLGDPAEFAALARHIVENPMLNGDVIRLDGALRMAPR